MVDRRASGSHRIRGHIGAGLVAVAALAAGLLLPPALAQDPGAQILESTSRTQRFLEGKLSAPGRIVKIGEIDGLLSSTIKVASVTVSDSEGLWLELSELSVTWNRLALARGRLSIDSLRAEEIRFLRKPVAVPDAGENDGGGDSSDDEDGGLPLSVIVRAIDLPAIILSADAVGTDAILSASGALTLTSKVVSAKIEATRLDGAGGTLAAEFGYDPDPTILTAKALLSEPAGGLAASALNLPGTPALALSLDGTGPIDDWQAELSLTADDRSIMTGKAAIRRDGEAYRGAADIAAQLGDLVPQRYQFLAGGNSRIVLAATRADSGDLSIEKLDYSAAQTQSSVSGHLTADYFPVDGQVSVTIDGGGTQVTLPAGEGLGPCRTDRRRAGQCPCRTEAAHRYV
ncbi:MAG: hypothetical protein ACTSSQ_04580 [Alphaproteobacteria bacterium]